MRDPLGLNERFFAFYFPKVMRASEQAGLAGIRRELVSRARGRTLELGAGSGLNLRHYPAQVSELVISEPSPHMLEHLRPLLRDLDSPVGSWELAQCGAEALPFDDASFDTVVGTFVFCSIPDPPRALAEIRRVLRPGGRLLFLEHVHAPEGGLLGRVQDLVELPHRYLAAGCYPNRRTEQTIRDSGLSVEDLAHASMPRGFPTVRPMILGSALR